MFLMVMMVVTLVPNVGVISKAYADVMDPLPHVTVGYIDEEGYSVDVYLNSETPYYVNGAHEATSDSSVSWNAYYDASTGILTYNNYRGAGVDIRSNRGYLNIRLIGNNYIGGKGQFGIYIQDELGITSDVGGTLTVETGKQDATSYGIISNHDSIFISGNADIIVRMNSDDAVYGIMSEEYSVVISDQASVDIECKSTGSFANGIDAKGLFVASANKIHYKGEGYGTRARLFSRLNNIMLANDAVITADIKGDSENCVYNPISELRNKLSDCGYRAVINEEEGWYHAQIEPKTTIDSTINISYDRYVLPDVHMYMTGEEAYAEYLEALSCPTNETYDGSGGWYVDLASEFSGISDDTGEGANLNNSSERLEFGEPYYIMFAIAIDDDNYVRNEEQKFKVNGSEDYLLSEFIDPATGKECYSVSIQQIAGYGPEQSVYVYPYNINNNYANDKVSFDGIDYDSSVYDYIPMGKTVTLYAQPAEDSEFIEWRKGDRDGETIGSEPMITVTIDSDDAYYAVFQKKIPAAGTLCYNVDYTFDEATGTVTLIPTGDDGEGGKTGIANVNGVYYGSPFYGNTKVKNIVVQEGITEIQNYVFNDNSISSVSLPASIRNITYRAFTDCSFEGAGFTVASGNENYSTIDGCLVREGNMLVKFAAHTGQSTYEIPDGITRIDWGCFENVDLDQLTLKGEGLILYNYAIRSSSIDHLVIEDGVKQLGDFSSFECLDATRKLPESITYAGSQNDFVDSRSIENFEVDPDNKYYQAIGGVLFEKKTDGLNLRKYPDGRTDTSYTVPSGVISVDSYRAFENKSLETVELPDSVKYIGYGAFIQLDGTAITVNDPECEFHSNAVYYCYNMKLRGYVGSTTQVYADRYSIEFEAIGENNGKLTAPENLRWDGAIAKWDAVEGARYDVTVYRLNDGTWQQHATEKVPQGTTEIDLSKYLWYADEEYYFTVSASKVTYEPSDASESSKRNGVINRTSESPTIEGDTLIFPTDLKADGDVISYFQVRFNVWNSSDSTIYNHWLSADSDATMNLRSLLNDKPYGTYKIHASLYATYYGTYSLEVCGPPEDVFIYYDYQPTEKISKIEITLPEMIVGMKSYSPEGLKVQAYAGDELSDGIKVPTNNKYWNNFEYLSSEGAAPTVFPEDKIEKGKYQYTYRLELDRRNGYEFADDVEIYVNGSKDNIVITSSYDNQINIRYFYPVGTQPLTIITEEMVGDITSKAYTGSAIKPKPAVTDGEVTLISGTDYTVSYKNNINAGKAYAVITGKNDYIGTVEKAFTITPKKITPKVSLSKTAYTYDGKAKKPTVTVKDGTKTLDKINYKVTYASGRKNTGKYKVTVKLTGNYVGTKSVYFKINPKGTTLGTLKAGSKSVTVNWKKQTAKMSTKRITGYQIMFATNSKFTKGKKTVTVSGYSKTSRKVTGLKGGKKYYVRIRTYTTISGTKYYSPWSKSKTVTTKK